MQNKYICILDTHMYFIKYKEKLSNTVATNHKHLLNTLAGVKIDLWYALSIK